MKKNIAFSLLASCAFNVYAADTASTPDTCQKRLSAGDYAQAISLAEESIRADANQRESYLCLGRAQSGAGNHADALKTFEKADSLSTNPYEHIIALTLLGNELKASGKPADAIATYRKSAALAREGKIQRYEMIDLNLIGETQQESGDAQSAVNSFEQAYKLAANDNERADCHAHLASAYSALGDHDHAISHQIKAVVMEERSGDLDHYAHANLELGKIYLAAKQYADAEKLMSRMLPVIVQAGDPYWEASIYEMQAQIKAYQGQPADAKSLIEKGVSLARKIGADALAQQIEQTRRGLKL